MFTEIGIEYIHRLIVRIAGLIVILPLAGKKAKGSIRLPIITHRE